MINSETNTEMYLTPTNFTTKLKNAFSDNKPMSILSKNLGDAAKITN